MNITTLHGFQLTNLARINLILGKNGCGKSTVLRQVETPGDFIPNRGNVTYLTPERGGVLIYEPHIEQQIFTNASSLRMQRNANQFGQFKQQTVTQYRKLLGLVSKVMEDHIEEDRPGKPRTFSFYLSRLNSLLDEIVVTRSSNGTDFSIVKKGTLDHVPPQNISSGEAELIAIGIEALLFEREAVVGKNNFLILDEPDVHLHPDLQVRLMHFIAAQVKDDTFSVILATHSTPILGALASHEGVHIAFMRSGDHELVFEPINDIYRTILPMFGAHPLSNVFNEAPLLLVEGEDDQRIWQQAVRSARGAISLYPCVCGSVMEISAYEAAVEKVLGAVYDNPRAYSLRDGDGTLNDLTDTTSIGRFKLQCYAAENLLLSNEVLASLGYTWQMLLAGIGVWLEAGNDHPHFAAMESFRRSGYDRRSFNVKTLRNDVMGIMGSEKPWEVAVGQVIATLSHDAGTTYDTEGSIYTYLGKKLVEGLLPMASSQLKS